MKTILIISILLLSGCAYQPHPNSNKITEANVEFLQRCNLVGQVYGDSMFAFLNIGMEIAKDKAKQQATSIGATHVAWSETNGRGFPYALGRAYKCKVERGQLLQASKQF